jgi:DNA-binding transcriptional regulator YdaS (Cro superfamily)
MPAAAQSAGRKTKKPERLLSNVEQAKAIMLEIRQTHGMQSKIASAIKVKPQAVHQWKMVPPEHCEAVAKITGHAPHELRPDHFNPPSRRAS